LAARATAAGYRLPRRARTAAGSPRRNRAGPPHRSHGSSHATGTTSAPTFA
jgi:hypothetical protein